MIIDESTGNDTMTYRTTLPLPTGSTDVRFSPYSNPNHCCAIETSSSPCLGQPQNNGFTPRLHPPTMGGDAASPDDHTGLLPPPALASLRAFESSKTCNIVLPKTSFTDAHLSSFTAALTSSSTARSRLGSLRQLHFFGNLLTDQSVPILLPLLPQCKQLSMINIAQNRLSAAALETLASAAMNCSCPLTVLNLGSNPGSSTFEASATAARLAAYLEDNRRLARERRVIAEHEKKRQRREAKVAQERWAERLLGLKVVVVGGGIGGLACALALAKQGVKSTVLEKDESFAARAQGYGLTMQQGTRAVRVLGIEEYVANASAWSAKHFIFAPSGEVLAFWGPTYTVDGSEKEKRQQNWQRVGGHNLHIPRQKLREALYRGCTEEAYRGMIEIQWGARVCEICQDERGKGDVVVKFQQGKEMKDVSASLVVCCDGIHSAGRKCLVGDPLEYLGIIVILGIFEVKAEYAVESDNYSLCFERAFQTCDGNTRMFVMPYSLYPKAMSMWQLTFYCTEEEALAWSKAGPEALRAEALKRCEGWHQPIPAMLKHTDTACITGYPVYDRLPTEKTMLPKSSRVILAGDAAHCMSPLKGQGANQALLDGVVIAESIKRGLSTPVVDMNDRVAEILRVCEKEIFERTKNKVQGSRATVKQLHQPAFLQPEFQVERRLGTDSAWGKEVIRRVAVMQAANITSSSPPEVLDEYAFSPTK